MCDENSRNSESAYKNSSGKTDPTGADPALSPNRQGAGSDLWGMVKAAASGAVGSVAGAKIDRATSEPELVRDAWFVQSFGGGRLSTIYESPSGGKTYPVGIWACVPEGRSVTTETLEVGYRFRGSHDPKLAVSESSAWSVKGVKQELGHTAIVLTMKQWPLLTSARPGQTVERGSLFPGFTIDLGRGISYPFEVYVEWTLSDREYRGKVQFRRKYTSDTGFGNQSVNASW